MRDARVVAAHVEKARKAHIGWKWQSRISLLKAHVSGRVSARERDNNTVYIKSAVEASPLLRVLPVLVYPGRQG